MTQTEAIENKILSDENLEKRMEDWKSRGLKTVFTNGCFDLLHFGHVDYLAKAKDAGDRLIIGVNTDASVRRLKGRNRPLQDENSRLRILASLQMVDAVILFDQDTPYNLISRVQPDILVKGADYKVEDIVGYDIVMQRGGKVMTLEYLAGYSTTSIEQRILNSK